MTDLSDQWPLYRRMMGLDDRYPEMAQYRWVQDFPRVLKDSKKISVGMKFSELPKIPLREVLTIIKETTSYPEVMQAYQWIEDDDDISEKEEKKRQHILGWYAEYLEHREGKPTLSSEMVLPMRDLASGLTYSGPDDPQLVEYFKGNPFVSEEL